MSTNEQKTELQEMKVENTEKREERSDRLLLNVEYLPCLNFAMTQNGRQCLEYCELTNHSDNDIHDLTINIEGDYIIAASIAVDIIPAHQTIRITDIDVKPDADKLRELTESVTTKFNVIISTEGQAIIKKAYDLRLLAFDEWSGSNVMPESLASFVTPNVPELSEIKVSAAKYLEKLTGSSALDEYQTQDPNRVRAQVAAIFEALRSVGIVYAAPPASYEKEGQRIRLADKVLAEKTGTCLDLSLLYASCLESCGLHPILILFNGHMFIGCWLIDKYHYQTISDDLSLLSKSIADGINELVLVEATSLTNSGKVAFEDAVKAAEKHIIAEENKFILFCDIYRCRLENIRPLPMRIDGKWETEGLAHEQATKTIKELRVEELNLTGGNGKITRQQIWERKLLDFSLRNNLLNIRIGKKAVPIASYNIEEMENNLSEGHDYQLMPCPAKKKITPNEFGIYDSRLYEDELKTVVENELQHDKLCTYHTEEELNSMTKSLFRDSRTALEENGANSLFIVFGLLKWYENDKSVRPRYAPLLLTPVDIIRKGVNNYIIRKRDEETTFNTTLVEMLKQQHEVNLTGLSPLPEDEHGTDVRKVFSIVRSHLTGHSKWDIIEECMLGLFSFNKFVMWNDIHNNADKLKENPIISSLINNSWTDEKESAQTTSKTDIRQLDISVEPHEYAIPVDVDSSQMEAVVESGLGNSFILYGPPGTGKSQTITNMIANALYHGKRILFVAEKMAALQVVQNRLAKIGLDPFCLELHSNKVTKTHLLHQLQTVLDIPRIKTPKEYEAVSKELYNQRSQLNEYMTLLHSKQSSGLSLYDCITRYEGIEGEEITPDRQFLQGITEQKLGQTTESIAQLDTVFAITGHPTKNPLNGLLLTDPSQSATEKLRTQLTELQQHMGPVATFMQSFLSQFGLGAKENISLTAWAERLIKAMEEMPVLSPDLLRIVSDSSLSAEWKQAIDAGIQRESLKAKILTKNAPEILNADAMGLKAKWQEIQDQFVVSRLFAKRSFIKSLKVYNSSIEEEDITPLIDSLMEYRRLSQDIATYADQSKALFGIYSGKWENMQSIMEKATAVISVLSEQVASPASVLSGKENLPTDADSIAHLRAFNKGLEELSGTITNNDLTISALQQQLPQWISNIDKARDWAQWCLRRKELEENNLQCIIDYLMSNENHSGLQAAKGLLKGCYRSLALEMIDSNRQLQMFNGLLFEDAIYKYRTIAKQFQELTKKILYCKLAANIPTQALEPSAASELGILKRYIATGGRGTTIRHIIDQIPTLLPRLCPVMLMSPISVAQFIDLNQDKFDIVCFDEASQMPTSEAVGAIARGKALICVGDPKQMPPTSFFSTNAVDESEADIDDMESILDDCITISLPAKYLTWHYRSRHESLIAFSNAQYYEGKLFTFPSIDDRVSKVQFIPVKGTYDFGKTRCNRSEAEAIVKEVVRRLSDKELSKRSIGIVSFSKVQQNLIEDLLTEELAKSPELEKAAYDVEEPIFIKNLENVQGDERDIILFSVGYGPDKNGKVSMNFGPLNNQGGERRLNVAVSRARYEMMVFSTLQPDQIDLRRSNAQGVQGLKYFLEFAKNGRMAISSNQMSKADENAEIVNAVAEEIRKMGYEVDTEVGRSQFKIDLAVSNPDDKDNYIMGIICDGKNYYETRTVRDREICRPSVLKGLGWHLMRIWAVDWFNNKEAVIKRISSQLEQIKKGEFTENDGFTAARKTAVQQALNMAFAVNEDELISEVTNDKAETYIFAPLKTNTLAGGRKLNKTEASKILTQLIAMEQPITASFLQKRLLEIYGIPKITPELQEFIEFGDYTKYIDPASPTDNPVYWENEEAAKSYNSYRNGGNREISDVPAIEIINAAKYAVAEQASVQLEGLKKQVTQMLGFARKVQKTDVVVEAVIAQLLDSGELVENNGNIYKG